MNSDRREEIQRILSRLAESYAAMMELMERALALLCEEMSLDPLTYFRTHLPTRLDDSKFPDLVVSRPLFTVTFRGRTCFLGNTLPFKFLDSLSQRPNEYLSYEVLFSNVWEGGVRTDSAVRSVVKSLRQRLREAGLSDLADAIDGTVAGHYALKVRP